MRTICICLCAASALHGAASAQPAPPPVPDFGLPGAEPGFHGVDELRASGRGLLDTEIRVKGYVTWIYDCAADLAPPGPAPTDVRPRGAGDPSLCQRRQLYLGATPDATATQVIRVVDPPLQVRATAGDHVTVTGTWGTDPSRGERDLGGVLVFRSIEASRPGAAAPRRAAANAPPVLPGPLPMLRPPIRDVDEPTRQQSLADARECERLRAARKLDEAIAACWRATNAWNGNEPGWISLARTQLEKRDWPAAARAALQAIRIEPDRAVSYLLHARALYEMAASSDREREEMRDRDGKRLAPVPGMWDHPLRSLLRATALDRTLWEAHHLLGVIYLHRDEPRAAAEALATSIAQRPLVPEPYLALSGLYRRWGYSKEALAIARAGTERVTGQHELAELWYELGLALDDQRDRGAAIDAFTKALERRPDHVAARFRRGQAHFLRKDRASARRDLDEVVRLGAPAGHVRQETHRMLRELAAGR